MNGENIADAAVMGEGTIDGRGWAKVLGKNVSWWDLAEQARAGADESEGNRRGCEAGRRAQPGFSECLHGKIRAFAAAVKGSKAAGLAASVEARNRPRCRITNDH